jgi:putative protein kinase ArgK-like GTPase of G3E family
LHGRRHERDRLNGLVAAAKAGRSQVLVLRGQPGIGKTALLDFLVERPAGCQVRRVATPHSPTFTSYWYRPLTVRQWWG